VDSLTSVELPEDDVFELLPSGVLPAAHLQYSFEPSSHTWRWRLRDRVTQLDMEARFRSDGPSGLEDLAQWTLPVGATDEEIRRTGAEACELARRLMGLDPADALLVRALPAGRGAIVRMRPGEDRLAYLARALVPATRGDQMYVGPDIQAERWPIFLVWWARDSIRLRLPGEHSQRVLPLDEHRGPPEFARVVEEVTSTVGLPTDSPIGVWAGARSSPRRSRTFVSEEAWLEGLPEAIPDLEQTEIWKKDWPWQGRPTLRRWVSPGGDRIVLKSESGLRREWPVVDGRLPRDAAEEVQTAAAQDLGIEPSRGVDLVTDGVRDFERGSLLDRSSRAEDRAYLVGFGFLLVSIVALVLFSVYVLAAVVDWIF
jgi:hypothetical protein